MAKQRSFFQGLRGKISMQMLLVSLIPVIVIGLLAYFGMSNSQNNASDSVDESRLALGSDLDDARGVLENDISEARAVLETDTVGAALSARAWALARELESWMGARILSVESYAAAPVIQSAAEVGSIESVEAVAANSFLGDQLGLTPYIALVTVADKDGMAIAGAWAQAQADGTTTPVAGIPPQMMAPPPDGVGGNMSYMPSWQALMASDYDSYVSDLYWVQEAGLYFIDIGVKVKDSDGKIVGTIIGSTIMWPSTMGPAYRGMYPDPNTRILFYSRDGHIMCDTGEWVMTEQGPAPMEVDSGGLPVQRWIDNNTMSPVPLDEIEFTPAEQTTRDIIATAPEELIPSTSFVSQQDNTVTAYARGANSVLYFGEQTEGFSGTGYSVVIMQPTEVAFAAIDKVDPDAIVEKIDEDEILSSLDDLENDLEDNTNSMLVTIILVLVVVFIVVLSLAFYISRGITRPIVQLSDAAEKVSMGELDVNVTVKSNDEIGDLAESFGRMVTAYRFMAQDEED